MSIEEKFESTVGKMKVDVFKYLHDYDFDDKEASINLSKLDNMIGSRNQITLEETFKIINEIGVKKYNDVEIEKIKSNHLYDAFLKIENNIEFLIVDYIYLRLILDHLENEKNKKEVKKLKETLVNLREIIDFRELLEYYVDITEDLYNKKILRSFYVNELAHLGEEIGVAYEIKTVPIRMGIFKKQSNSLEPDKFYDVTKIIFSLQYLIRTKAYYRYINDFLDSDIIERLRVNGNNNFEEKVTLGNNFNDTGSNEYKDFVKRVKRIFKITGVDMKKFLVNNDYKFTLDSLEIIIDIDSLRDIKTSEGKAKISEEEIKKNEAFKYLKENYKKKQLQTDIVGLELIIEDMKKIIEENLDKQEAKKQIKAMYKKLRYEEKREIRDIQKKLEEDSKETIDSIKKQ